MRIAQLNFRSHGTGFAAGLVRLARIPVVALMLAGPAPGSDNTSKPEQRIREFGDSSFDLNAVGGICDWLVCGPFPNPGEFPGWRAWDEDSLERHGGEMEIFPDPTMSYRVHFPRLNRAEHTVHWRLMSMPPEVREYVYVVDLWALFSEEVGLPAPGHMAGYAFCWIDAPADMPARIKLTTPAAPKLWLNHKLLLSKLELRSGDGGGGKLTNVIPVRLRKGANAMLIKLVFGKVQSYDQMDSGCYFSVCLFDGNNRPLTDKVKVRLALPKG